MYFKKIEILTQRQLFEELRGVTLFGKKDKLPYLDAEFEIKTVQPQDLQPSSFYVLKQRLNFLALLVDELIREKKELEKIDTILEYKDEFDHQHRIIPPIVELTDFKKWMILDGEHRIYIAMERHVEITVLFIRNVKYPYPCLPLPNGWKSVKIVETVPKVKRLYRPGLNDTEQTHYTLHRDLDRFGSQGTRKLSPIV